MTTTAVAQRISYGPFGETTYEIGDDNLHPFAYAGGMYDAATQLYRFGARDYDPRIGRWTAKDPIRWEGGQCNLYEYVGGDAVNGVDPSGLQTNPSCDTCQPTGDRWPHCSNTNNDPNTPAPPPDDRCVAECYSDWLKALGECVGKPPGKIQSCALEADLGRNQCVVECIGGELP